MADSRGSLRSLFSLLLMVATGLGLYNVYGDSAHVEKKAAIVGCAGQECPFTVSQAAKNPLFHSYTLAVKPAKQSRRTVDVECKRAFYLLGEYSCVVTEP